VLWSSGFKNCFHIDHVLRLLNILSNHIFIEITFIVLSFSSSDGATDDCTAYPFYFCGDGYENYEDGKCHYTPNWFYCEGSSDGCIGGNCGDREEIVPA